MKSYKNGGELGELTPSNLLSFSGNDLFSQIWILPGVTGLPTGYNFQVDGGSNDENQLLLDGVPVYHPGHINSLLPVFNGDAARWGAKYAYEVYELAEQDDLLRTRHEPVHQFSLFYDNLLRLTPRLTAQVGVHFVGYLPRHTAPTTASSPASR